MMDKVLTDLGKTGDADTIFLSIAAGVRICDFENAVNKNMGGNRAVIRAMPNTPAAIGAGISAVVCNKATSDTARDLADDLLSAVGAVIHLEGEDKMDAVTAVSGSGPAYVFHLIEAMVAAGIAQGLPADIALNLARTTVAGAGALAQASDEVARTITYQCDLPRWHDRGGVTGFNGGGWFNTLNESRDWCGGGAKPRIG